MDFNWMPQLGFWIFPLLCVLFMALMMFGCGGLRSRCCDGTHKKQSPQGGSPDLESRP